GEGRRRPAEPRAIIRLELDPTAAKALDLDRHAEVGARHLRERVRGAPVVREEARVEEQGRADRIETRARRAEREPGDRADRAREGILSRFARSRESDEDPVLRPRLVEERDEPVMEDVEKVAKSLVSLAKESENEARIVGRQHSVRAGETEKAHRHLERLAAGAILPDSKRDRVARREARALDGAEAKRFARRELAARIARAGRERSIAREAALREADGLEELESVGLAKKPLDQRSARSPHLGCHAFSRALALSVQRATVLVNEFTLA